MNQKEVLNWRIKAFVSQPTTLLQAAKIAEEAGEVLGAVLKRHQGIKQHINWSEELKKEMCDLLYAMFTVAELEGFDLLATAGENWKEVKQRTYKT